MIKFVQIYAGKSSFVPSPWEPRFLNSGAVVGSSGAEYSDPVREYPGYYSAGKSLMRDMFKLSLANGGILMIRA